MEKNRWRQERKEEMMTFNEKAEKQLTKWSIGALESGPLLRNRWREAVYRKVCASIYTQLYRWRVDPVLKLLFQKKIIAKFRHGADTWYYLREQVPKEWRVKDYEERAVFCDWLDTEQNKPELAAAWRRTIIREPK